MSNMISYRDGLKNNSYTRETFIAKFKDNPSTKQFMWERLQGLDLSGLELPRTELRGADLTGTDFSGSNLAGSNFREAVCRDVNFSGCNLREASFAECDIRGANFSGAKLDRMYAFYKTKYNSRTVFPNFFKFDSHDLIRVGDIGLADPIYQKEIEQNSDKIVVKELGTLQADTPKAEKINTGWPLSQKDDTRAMLIAFGIIGIILIVTTIIIILGGLHLVSTVEQKVIDSDTSLSIFSLDSSVTPNPGWKKFLGGNVELWLPASYKGGDIDKDLPLIVAGIRELGSEFEPLAQMVEENRDFLIIFAYDTNIRPSDLAMRSMSAAKYLIPNFKLEDYIELALNQAPDYFDLVLKEFIYLGGHRVGRYIVKHNIIGGMGNVIVYVIKNDNEFYEISFGFHAKELDQMLIISEEAIRTFRINP